VQARDFIQDTMQLALRKTTSASNLESFKDSVQSFATAFSERLQLDSCPLEPKQIELIAISLFSRREELA